MSLLPLSAVIITKNAAAQLSACIAALAFCDEVLVVDSGSGDGTPAIARELGAHVIETEWRGFGPQKQFAVGQAKNDWVLCIDADERVSESLRQSLLAVFSTVGFAQPTGCAGVEQCSTKPPLRPAPSFTAYRFARCNRFMGRYLRHGEGYPDWSLRLFDRRAARWSDDPVHEKVIATGAIGTLQGDLLHESAESLDSYLAKQNRYSTLAAKEALAAGRRASVAQLLLSPILRFLKFYLLRRGFLDGVPGLVHILIGCQNSFLKYAKMLAMQGDRP